MDRQKEIRFAISLFQSTLLEMRSEMHVTRDYLLFTSSNASIRNKLRFRNLGKIFQNYRLNIALITFSAVDLLLY